MDCDLARSEACQTAGYSCLQRNDELTALRSGRFRKILTTIQPTHLSRRCPLTEGQLHAAGVLPQADHARPNSGPWAGPGAQGLDLLQVFGLCLAKTLEAYVDCKIRKDAARVKNSRKTDL